MITETITATTTATDLKTLMETAGHTFSSSGNDNCSGIILQLDPAEATNYATVLSAGKTEGMALVNDGTQPTTIAFRVDQVRRVYLLASASTVAVNVLIEQVPSFENH